ncbi:MAG: (2Fe-2S)-binding protein [Alphaproteobacteria bacterium]|nr:(2Fe-2S)-binding protein [Alphaproteobacteria bacterium]
MATVTLNVNGASHTVDVPSLDMPLLWVLRDLLGLTGTKYGCGIERCGACSIFLDGELEKSCDKSVSEAVGRKVVTIEGLSANSTHPVQLAWIAKQVPQCGYCQSGMLLAAARLLAEHPRPSDSEIAGAMKNICMCGTYPRIRDAIKQAAGMTA